jgi:hypothetical protein
VRVSRRILIFGGCTNGGYSGDCNGKTHLTSASSCIESC